MPKNQGAYAAPLRCLITGRLRYKQSRSWKPHVGIASKLAGGLARRLTWISSSTMRTSKDSVRTFDLGLSSHRPSVTQNRQACHGQMTSVPSKYPADNDAPMCGHASLIAKYAPSRRNTAISWPFTGNALPSPSGIEPTLATVWKSSDSDSVLSIPRADFSETFLRGAVW